jgi:3-deoxy-D-manno-octulosonic-acid transferase
MLALYSLILYSLLPFILLRLLYRSIKNPAYRRRVKERFGLFKSAPQANGIWIHAVSVGEAIAAVKLVKAMQSRYPQRAMTVTCGTPTGSEIIKQQLGASVFHVYAPYDLPGSVKRFLNKCQPAVGIIMETEIWPNLLHQASRSGIKILISNMRLSETSFRRYQKFSRLMSRSLASVDHIAAQTEIDAKRAIALGADAEKVQVVGNLKFEIENKGTSETQYSEQLKNQIAPERAIWLAGSTHEGEDKPILNVHDKLLEADSTLLLTLVPRHPERFESVYQLCRQRFTTQKRSELDNGGVLKTDTQVLLLDTIGELDQFISISDWAFIGGSLVPVGGHNILEACQAGVPVIFGEFMSNFKQIAQLVIQKGAGMQVADQAGLLRSCSKLSNDADKRKQMGENGLALMQTNQGALPKTLKILDRWV